MQTYDDDAVDATALNPSAGALMTLATIAYSSPSVIPHQLAYPGYATRGAYNLVWVGTSAANQMYVAQLRGQPRWVVAIRGSVGDPHDEAFWLDWLIEDNPFLTQPWPYDTTGRSSTTTGLQLGLAELLGMRDPAQGFLMDFLWRILRSLPSQAIPQAISVVGHSLGGALTPLLAAYVYERICKPHGIPATALQPVTFAGPTSGNAAFAAYIERLFGGFAHRYVNSLDVAPKAWSPAGLDWIRKSYRNGPKIDPCASDLVADAEPWAKSFGFTQPGRGVVLDGQILPGGDWYAQAGHQHVTATYLKLLKAPPVNVAQAPRLRIASEPRWDADFADEIPVELAEAIAVR